MLHVLSSLLQGIPDDFKPLAAIAIGSVILVGMVLFHGSGLHAIMVSQNRMHTRISNRKLSLAGAAFAFGWSVFQMLGLQIVEILIWAIILWQLGLLKNAHNAIYFCANAYTTLGMGKMELEESWRLISPIIGISGLFTFAWTTSALVDVVTAHRQWIVKLEAARKRRLNKMVPPSPEPAEEQASGI
jgi:hypothetical protein